MVKRILPSRIEPLIMANKLPEDLIGHLYDAAVEPRLWQGLALRIAEAFESTSAVVKIHDAEGAVDLFEITDNLRVPEQRRAWAEDWHRRDLWVHRTLAHGMDRVVTSEHLVTPEEQQRGGFYQEWLPSFDIFHMVGATFSLGEGAVGVLGIHRPDSAAPYDPAEQRRAALLLPHLARAVRLGQQLARADLARMAALSALDHLESGVVVLDPGGRLRHANAAAEEVLRHSPDLGLLHGRLYLRDPLLQGRFALALRAAIEAASGRPAETDRPAPGAALAIPRLGRLPLTLALAPLRPRWSQGADPGPLALLFLRDPERAGLHLDRLRALFGLTPTEALVASDLATGTAPEEIASRHGMAMGTLRWHLKSILAKTGTTRQAQAVALLARSVAAMA